MRRGAILSRSSPLKASVLADLTDFRGSRSISARDVRDLPEPDSPTMQSVSPRLTSKLIPRTAFNVPAPTGISTKSEEHTSELQSLMRISYAVFCLKNKIYQTNSLSYHQSDYRQSYLANIM